MCLAPCFGGCTHEEYLSEVDRIVQTLASGGQSLIRSTERERDAASEALDFEHAAALQKRLEKVNETLRGLPEIARPIDLLDAVILQRALQENTVLAFLIRGGVIASVFPLSFGDSGEPRSVEHILRQQIEPPAAVKKSSGPNDSGDSPAANAGAGQTEVSVVARDEAGQLDADHVRAKTKPAATPIERSEHLSLIAKWFYSRPRQGEIFFRAGDWPYRRIIRACSRVLAPPKP